MTTKRVWNRFVALLMALAMIFGMMPSSLLVRTSAAVATKTFYLKPGVWTTDGAWFQAWVWGSSEADHWVTATDSNGDGTYELIIPADATGMKILRKDPNSAANTWTSWNDSGDLSIGTNNCYTINNWGSGSLSTISEQYNVSYTVTGLTHNGAAKATYNTAYSVTFAASSGYSLPTSVTVTVGGVALTSGTHYTYSSSTGKLTIKAGSVTGAIAITAQGKSTGYTVTFNGSNVTSDGASIAVNGTNYTATLTPATGYNLPASITVTVGGSTLSTTRYSYNSTTGALTITGSYITGAVVITANAAAKTYSVSFEGTNVSSSGSGTATHGIAYTATLSAATGYDLPDTITVTVGSTTLASGTGYTYSASTGKLTINAAYVTGNITIVAAAGVTGYTVTFSGSNVTSSGAATAFHGVKYTAVLTPATGYQLPTTITVKVGGTTLSSNRYTYSSTTGELSIIAGYVTGNITITATATKASYTVTFNGSNVTSSGSSAATYGTNYTATLTPATGYNLPASITVTVGGSTLSTSGYSYSSSTGKLTITGTYITGAVVINATATAKTYTVTFSGTNVTSTGGNSATHGTAYTATLKASSGYSLPQSITVKLGTTTLTEGTGYTYDAATGALSIPAANVTNTISITAAATKNYYVAGVSELTGSYWDAGDANNLMTPDGDGTYSMTYSDVAAGSYSFKVTDGTWNNSWGGSGADGNYEFTLDVKSDVIITFDSSSKKITVTTVPLLASYSVSFSGTNVTFSGEEKAYESMDYSATLSPASGYSLPDSITVKVNGRALSTGAYSYDSTTGALTITGSYVTGNVTISAVGDELEYYIVGTEELCGVDWTIHSDNLMTASGSNIYTLTFYNVPAAANGTYMIKVQDSAGEYYSGNDDGSNYWVNVGYLSDVTITFNASTNTITYELSPKQFDVSFSGSNIAFSGADTVNTNNDYTATLTPDAGYKLPSSVKVSMNGTAISSGYTYNSSTGVLTIDKSAITGDIEITANGVEQVYVISGTSNLCGSNWNPSDTNNKMTRNADGTYSITYSPVAAGDYQFKVTLNGSYIWPSDNYYLNLTAKSSVTITYNPEKGEGSVSIDVIREQEPYDRQDEVNLAADSVFYVDVDLVDYLNNNRVYYNEAQGYYTDNQGEWLGSKDAVYSYLNHLISQQVYNGNQYTYPLYFGPLHFIESRYSMTVGSTDWNSLGNWSTAANVALGLYDNEEEINTSGVVQGLVASDLDANGNLKDPVTGAPLLYFNQTAAEGWTNEGHRVMAYYDNLKFPFKMAYDATKQVTTYSYDSAKDYAVYYDYENNQLYASNTHVQDQKDNDGFYPLNEPDDSDNEVNNGFGAKFSINFTVGDDGKLATGDPITFTFTGDDDVWVFIDGKLVLDMGGAHAMATGTIDFANLTATVKNAGSVTNSYVVKSLETYKPSSYRNQGYDNWLYNGDTEERAILATKDTPKKFSELGLGDFQYGEVHNMTVFYMERGMFESNFSMEFTMVPVPSGLTISKELNEEDINKGVLKDVSGVADYNFAMTATSPDTTSVAFSKFTVTNKYTGETKTMYPQKPTESGTNPKVFQANILGVSNYAYAHSFFNDYSEDAFVPGTTFKLVETTSGVFQYVDDGTTWALYDANDSYRKLTSSTGRTAEFTMGTAGSNTSYSYAVAFSNVMKLGTLQISKEFSDAVLGGTAFSFQVLLDLDGAKNEFPTGKQYDLTYTVKNTDGTRADTDGVIYTAKDGIVSISGGQTAVITGIPAGATYSVTEIIPEDAPWEQTGVSNATGTISYNESVTAVFTNAVKSLSADKAIFVEAGSPTDYTLKYDGEEVTVSSVGEVTGLTVTYTDTKLTVTAAEPDKAYVLSYEGRLPGGELLEGTVTVYSFAATNKIYVFDFGLASNLADTTRGDGLFQGGKFYNSHISGETPVLATLTGADGNCQTTVTAEKYGTIGTDGSHADVIFTPVAFMNRVETYTYTVQITAPNKVFKENDPETGCIVEGKIRVMPANSVYYEDNFNATGSDSTEKFVFSANGPGVSPDKTQSNDQSGNYGFDSAYSKGYTTSGGSETTLSSGEFMYFTFSGSGFDLISRTNGSTAGFAVYIFAGDHDDAYIDYLTTFSGAKPDKMMFVDTYYNNGDLYQVPVVSIRGLSNKTHYTAYIQALATSTALTTVTIDGVRIYNPLIDTSAYPLANEKNTVVDELRSLYKVKGIVSLAGRVTETNSFGMTSKVFQGLGKQAMVEKALEQASIVEDMEHPNITCVSDVENIYLYGPNNEMYLPTNFGIGFSYQVNSANWTMQIGAKAVSAAGTAKSFTVYARESGGTYSEVTTITLTSTTDLYYDLTASLKDHCTQGKVYDIIIISNSAYADNEFVSLTTVKHSGLTLS